MAYTVEDLYALYQGGGQPQPAGPVVPGEDLNALYEQTTGRAPIDAQGYAAEGSVDTRQFAGDPTANVANQGLEAPTREGAGLPEQTPGEAAMQSMKSGGGWGASASVGTQGYSQGKYQQVSKQDAERNAAMGNAAAGVQAQYAPVADAYAQSNASQKDAAQAKTDAEMAKLSDEQTQALYLKGLTDSFRQEEQVATASEMARLNKTIADYQASLADYSASKVNPNEMWDGMTGGMRFGTMVTAFVHDFLGAKGIKTSAMETFKGAIDRNINAQLANINKKGEVTKGFKALYDLQSQQAKSTEEIRTRIRGFYLESAKQHVIANMSQYKSLMATAEGRKAMAEIDKEMAKNYMDFTKQVTQDSTVRMAQDQQWIMHKGNLAMEGYKASISAKANALAERKWEDELKQRAEKTKSAEMANALVDPADNMAKRIIVRGSDKEQQNVREAMINTHETNASLKEIRRLVLDNKATLLDEAGVRRWSPEGRKLAEALIDRLAHSQVKANGERATNEDVQQYKKLFPLDQNLDTGIKHMYDYAQASTLKHADTYIKQYTQDLPKEKWISGGNIGYFAEDTVRANAEYGEFQRGGKMEQAVDKAQQFLGSPSNSLDNGDLTKLGIDKSDIKLDHAALTGWNPEPEAWTAGVYILGKAAAGGDKDAQATLNKIAQTSFADAQRDPALKGFNYTDFNNLRTYAIMKTKSLDPNRNPGRFKAAQDQEDGTAPFPVMTPDQVYEQNKIQ